MREKQAKELDKQALKRKKKQAEKREKRRRKQGAAEEESEEVEVDQGESEEEPEEESDNGLIAEQVAAASAALSSAEKELQSVVRQVHKSGAEHNLFTNLAWTLPTNCSKSMDHDISADKVAAVALDMFTDTSLSSKGSVDGDGEAGMSVLERTKHPISWKVPQKVERGFGIPILVAKNFDNLVIGKFQRIALDVYVNATWMAWSWAKKEGNDEAASAIENLILDWPMDFILIEGESIEEIERNMFKWRVNMAAKAERHCDFVGLENTNMMAIVAKAAELVNPQSGSDKRKIAKPFVIGCLRMPIGERIIALIHL
jgi:hypothetical protein